MMSLQKISQTKVAGGSHQQYTHTASTLNCDMRFAIFLPETASQTNKVPVLYWLSGLTCTDENFMQKAGAFKRANELGIAIVAADTSPRGDNVPDDENAAYDFGLGAGFYINATQAPWNKHYKMYDYITEELPKIIEANFPVSDKKSISGHSMGGHGALIIGLKNQDDYQSISAFSPICSPMNCPWGIKAFTGYLGSDKSDWLAFDASELLKQGSKRAILVDLGEDDGFLVEQLKPELLERAAEQANVDSNPVETNLVVRRQAGYDHSYFFISSFIDDHLGFHARYLKT